MWPGDKVEGCYLWPVRIASSPTIPKTGQTISYAPNDDGDLKIGVEWPNPRLTDIGNGTVLDNLTNLTWTQTPILSEGQMTWPEALQYVAKMNGGIKPNYGKTDWRLPNPNEMKSLTDYSSLIQHFPQDILFFRHRCQTRPSGYRPLTVPRLHKHGGSIFLLVGWIPRQKLPHYNFLWPVRGGTLDHFEFSIIPSPQSVGVPFSITITIKDTNGNTVPDFNGPVTLSATIGNVTPTTINLVSGVSNENVSLDAVGNGTKIIASSNGKQGESNAFIVAGFPSITTGSATDVTTNSATLNGTVNANNASTTVTLQYGLNTSYGTTVAADQSPVTGNSNTAVSKGISGLSPNTIYHYRLVGMNSSGTTNGSDLTFTTQKTPSATTNEASGVTTSGATLNGIVNPNGTSTNYYFQWGTTISYGNNTSTHLAGNGTSDVNVSAPITSLTPGTTYHYRIVATSIAGTIIGGDQAFNTLAVDTTPNAFTFTDQTGVALNLIISNAISVDAINTASPITINGGTYSVSTDGGSNWSTCSATTPSTVSLNDRVKVCLSSSSSFSTVTNSMLTIGTISDTFSVTTWMTPSPMPSASRARPGFC